MDEATARAKAAKILETSGVGKLLDMGPWEDLIDFISAALLAASRPAPGYLREAIGPDRKVLERSENSPIGRAWITVVLTPAAESAKGGE